MTTSPRHPYVGAGEDGARRSAQIDREEADTLSWSDPRHDELIASAERWEDQAHRLVLERLGPRPTLEQLREHVGNENWLAALALLDLSPVLAVLGHHVGDRRLIGGSPPSAVCRRRVLYCSSQGASALVRSVLLVKTCR